MTTLVGVPLPGALHTDSVLTSGSTVPASCGPRYSTARNSR